MSAPVALLLPTRFVGLDVHKQSIMVTAVDAHQQTVLRPRRLAHAEFAIWAQMHLEPTAAVVLEATTNAWPLYDLLQPLVAWVTVVHSNVVHLLPTARVKTDARDALHLARLLSTGVLTSIWVPPKEVRELRTLMAHRRRLVQQRTQIRNHLQRILHAYNLTSPAGEPFAQQQREWWLALEVGASER
jgi:transposase